VWIVDDSSGSFADAARFAYAVHPMFVSSGFVLGTDRGLEL
jgi:hypothetical protein